MEVRTQRSQREIELRRKKQNEECLFEFDSAMEQAKAYLNRHHSDAEGGHEFEHERGQQGDAEHLHRRGAKPFADAAKGVAVGLGPAQNLEGCEPLDRVEEEGAEPAHRQPLLPRPNVGEPSVRNMNIGIRGAVTNRTMPERRSRLSTNTATVRESVRPEPTAGGSGRRRRRVPRFLR